MDHTYQRPLQLPACCSVLSAEEMTYTEGGALSINITPEQVMAFGINATVNLLGMMGRYAFQAAVSGMQNALNDGLGVGDAIGHYWGKLNTWSKVATIGMAGLGGYYAYCQARSIYLSIKKSCGRLLRIRTTKFRPKRRQNRRPPSSRIVCLLW